MAFDYAGLRDGTVIPLIKRLGKAITLTKPNVSDTFDPTTGVVTVGTATTDTGYAVEDFSGGESGNQEREGSVVDSEIITLFCVDIAEPVPFKDTITMGGVVYSIEKVNPVRPGSVDIMYEVELHG